MPKQQNRQLSAMRMQAGLTLVELMVGIIIGLLVVGVAVAGLMASRGASATVSDATQLQQQASYAFRVLGQQIRQAGSLELNLDTEQVAAPGSSTPLSAASKVGFEVGYTEWGQILDGKDTPNATEFALTVGYQNYFEDQFDAASTKTLFRDCLGEGGARGAHSFIINRFAVRDGALVCSGTTGNTQPIIRNVSDFRVRYYVQDSAATGAPTLKRVDASGVTQWANVVALEVCLDLVGERPVDLPADSKYRDCADADVTYGGRMHQVFRNVFQLRSQGVLG